MSITASEISRIGRINQVSDDILNPSYKWLVLNQNVLDGSYHSAPDNDSYEVGWWSNSISDTNGEFSIPPVITLTFDAGNLGLFIIYGDALYGTYIVAFDYVIKDINGNILKEASVVNNTNAIISIQLFPLCKQATSLTITIHKINQSNVAAKVLEISTIFAKIAADTILLKGIELPVKITNHFSTTEQIKIHDINVVKNLINHLYPSDRISPKGIDMYKMIYNHLFPKETVYPIILDVVSDLTNIHSVMKEHVRQVFAKMQILYTDPLFDSVPSILTSDDNYIADKAQVIDGKSGTEYNWFSLFENKLDGSYHCPDSNSSIGWWGNTLSNDDGSFNTPQSIALLFDARPIDKLVLSGDDIGNCYPVDFDFNLYQGNTIVYTREIRGNTQINYSEAITPIGSITKMEAKIYKLNRKNVCRVTEFFSLVKQDYDMNRIADMHLLEELAYEDSEVPLGAISSNEIDISLLNHDGLFDISNQKSILYGMLRKNRKVIVWLGAKVKGDEIEWHQLGVFWTTEWKSPFSSINASVTARDMLELMRTAYFNTSQLYTKYSAYQLYEVLFQAFGLNNTQYIIDESLQNIIIPYAWFDRITYRECLDNLTKCLFVKVYCDRDGILHVQDRRTDNQWMTQLDMNHGINDFDFPNASVMTTNCIEITVNKLTAGDKTNIYSCTDKVSIPANGITEVTCAYTSIPNLNVDAPQLTMDTGLSLVSYSSYVWGVILKIQNSTANALNINSISIDGVPLNNTGSNVITVQDDYSVQTEGVQMVQVNEDFIQDDVYATQLANMLLGIYSNQKADITLDTPGDIALVIGQNIEVSTQYVVDKPYTIFRQDLEYDGGLHVDIDCKVI